MLWEVVGLEIGENSQSTGYRGDDYRGDDYRGDEYRGDD
jgi:hypothetical protein